MSLVDDFLYDVYQVCLKHDKVPLENRQKCLEHAGDQKSASWAVHRITLEALRTFVQQGNTKGLERAHELARCDRAKQMLAALMSKEEFIAFFRKHDKTVLTTTGENDRHGTRHWTTVYEVPSTDMFKGHQSVRASKDANAWAVRQLADTQQAKD